MHTNTQLLPVVRKIRSRVFIFCFSQLFLFSLSAAPTPEDPAPEFLRPLCYSSSRITTLIKETLFFNHPDVLWSTLLHLMLSHSHLCAALSAAGERHVQTKVIICTILYTKPRIFTFFLNSYYFPSISLHLVFLPNSLARDSFQIMNIAFVWVYGSVHVSP